MIGGEWRAIRLSIALDTADSRVRSCIEAGPDSGSQGSQASSRCASLGPIGPRAVLVV